MCKEYVCYLPSYLQVNSSLATSELFVLVEDEGEPLQEEYHGMNVSYPDFFNEGIGVWFTEHLSNLTTNIDDMLGGFVLQDNWPAVNTTQNITEDMVYVPEVSPTSAGGNEFRE
jgi:hypothetical protein